MLINVLRQNVHLFRLTDKSTGFLSVIGSSHQTLRSQNKSSSSGSDSSSDSDNEFPTKKDNKQGPKKSEEKAKSVAGNKTIVEKFVSANKKTAQKPKLVSVEQKNEAKTKTLSPDPRQKMSELLRSAQMIKPVSKNDPKSITSKLATPKTFIRDSARPPHERVKGPVHDPTEEIINTGLDKRLVDAARRVASRMPKNLSQKTENDLLSYLSDQKAETEKAKKEFTKHPRQDKTKSLSYKILNPSRPNRNPPSSVSLPRPEEQSNMSITEIVKRTERTGRQNTKEAFKKFEKTIISTRPSVIPAKIEVLSKTKDGKKSQELLEFEEEEKFFRNSKFSKDFDSGPRTRGYKGQRDVGGFKKPFNLDEQMIAKSRMFIGEGLNIFGQGGKDKFENTDLNRNLFWEELKMNEDTRLKFPNNGFQEMINWTKEGKLWQFPIDNEQGLDAEAEVPFYDHVLLDGLLEGFPEEGPIRNFMELVLMGLSHNPYISVDRKRATVEYYRTYFDEHGLTESAEATQ